MVPRGNCGVLHLITSLFSMDDIKNTFLCFTAWRQLIEDGLLHSKLIVKVTNHQLLGTSEPRMSLFWDCVINETLFSCTFAYLTGVLQSIWYKHTLQDGHRKWFSTNSQRRTWFHGGTAVFFIWLKIPFCVSWPGDNLSKTDGCIPS